MVNNLSEQLSRLVESLGIEFRSASFQNRSGWPRSSRQVYPRFSKSSILKYLWSLWERGMLATTWKTKTSVSKTLGLKALCKSLSPPATNILRKTSESSDNLGA